MDQKVNANRNNSDNNNSISNSEIANQTAEVIESIGGVAKSLENIGLLDTETENGSKTSEIAQKTANAIKSIPVAVKGIEREINPVKNSFGKLWNSLEKRGIVKRREPSNFTDFQKKK